MNPVEKLNPNELLAVMNTYARVLPADSILAQNRRGLFHIIIPRDGRNQRVTLTDYQKLVNFCDARVEG